MAFRAGERDDFGYTDDAELGALLEADFQAHVVGLVKGLSKSKRR